MFNNYSPSLSLRKQFRNDKSGGINNNKAKREIFLTDGTREDNGRELLER